MERLHHSFAFDAADWPADRCTPAAVLAISPEIMSGWFGVEFGAPADRGATGRTAGVELPSGRRVLLRWDDAEPEPRAMRLLADRADDPDAACDEALLVLGLSSHDVIWRAARSGRSRSSAEPTI